MPYDRVDQWGVSVSTAHFALLQKSPCLFSILMIVASASKKVQIYRGLPNPADGIPSALSFL